MSLRPCAGSCLCTNPMLDLTCGPIPLTRYSPCLHYSSRLQSQNAWAPRVSDSSGPVGWMSGTRLAYGSDKAFWIQHMSWSMSQASWSRTMLHAAPAPGPCCTLYLLQPLWICTACSAYFSSGLLHAGSNTCSGAAGEGTTCITAPVPATLGLHCLCQKLWNHSRHVLPTPGQQHPYLAASGHILDPGEKIHGCSVAGVGTSCCVQGHAMRATYWLWVNIKSLGQHQGPNNRALRPEVPHGP